MSSPGPWSSPSMSIPVSLTTLALMGAFFSVASAVLPKSRPTVHFSAKPATLAVKRASQNSGKAFISLRELVESKCSSLFTPFRPVWWLFNGHLQTIYCVLGNFKKSHRMQYNRKLIRLADGGTLGLDFAPIDWSSTQKDSPIIVVQHGLTGGSYESYVRSILHPACKPVEEGGLGYRAIVVNFRGCAGVPVTSPQLYSAGHTDDLRQALAWISHHYPEAPLLGVGYSLGANVMTRYVAEEGTASRLKTACVLACPWDLAENNEGLLRSFLGKHVYQKGMGGNLQNMVIRHQKSLLQFPEHFVAKAVPLALNLKNPTLAEFDETFTKIAGGSPPIFPFQSASDYYRWASSHHLIKDIKIPFLALNAVDDPVVKNVPLDAAGNGMVVMCLTTGGGHLGWFEQSKGGQIDRWVTKPVLEWFKAFGEDVIRPAAETDWAATFIDEEGFVREQGRKHLGSKQIPGGGVVDGNGTADDMLQGL
ncbi:hypothetical protein AX16_003631 [Volvariella volvacea WC 439]|nr:hypothetical protein AX16_003631 [Volvariella volvacea WC 439]